MKPGHDDRDDDPRRYTAILAAEPAMKPGHDDRDDFVEELWAFDLEDPQ